MFRLELAFAPMQTNGFHWLPAAASSISGHCGWRRHSGRSGAPSKLLKLTRRFIAPTIYAAAALTLRWKRPGSA